LRVEVVSRAGRPPLAAARCRRLLEAAARRLPPPPASRPASGRTAAPSITVLFARAAAMRALNARFRGLNRSTDVLSFPAAAVPGRDLTPEGVHLGDLAIGVEAARRQARQSGHALSREVELLLLHGYIHLLGYDHETDGGRMERLERSLRRRLALENPRRVGAT
jgi:probable rRNA maturation factor